ncbi:MAG: ABC transporter permease subunit [Myxococcales bacterium]|nr:ABC transporter permease subunit [Myxococcales bacterium]
MGAALGYGALALLLWPLVYATWLSFAPGELLAPPVGEWSLRWYAQFAASPQWTAALGNSLVVGAGATVIAVIAGTGAALAGGGRRWIAALVVLPMFVPAVVLGMGLLPLVQALGIWGTRLSIAAAHGVWAMPVVFLVTRAAIEALDPALAAAARGLGASRWQVGLRVTLPLIAPSVAVGALMAFVLSLNEFVIALFLGTPASETLPKVIWPSLRYTLTPLVAAASAIATGVTLLAMAAMAGLWWLRGRRSIRAEGRTATRGS